MKGPMFATIALASGVAGVVLPDFCDLQSFKFGCHDGSGDGLLMSKALGGCDAVQMWSANASGMAASFQSPSFAVQGGRRYKASFQLLTEELVPLGGGVTQGAAALTGGIYLHFFDGLGDSGAWNPQFGTLAPADTGGKWREISAEFVVPTTAATAVLHLAFAAHSTAMKPNRMLSGLASGNCSLANVSLVDVGAAPPLPATIQVPDKTLQRAIGQAFECLGNSQQSGNFTVGAGYTISDNISPDLTFGLHGVRRTAHDKYMETMKRQWQWHAPDSSGHYFVGRVMGHINWPLGVDNIFSYTGDQDYLREQLPAVDAAFAYAKQHTGEDGLVTFIPKGHGAVGGGADWVDWYVTRLDGRSFQFHMWYVRALRRFAELHKEFASSFGNATLGLEYAQRADDLVLALQKLWTGSHWWTNPDYEDEGEWMDDSIWSIYHDIASQDRERQILDRIDGNGSFFEGVPLRWTAFKKPSHGACSWFGRLGAGDIMTRYKRAQAARGYALLQRIADVITEHGNIYEGYDMNGCGLQSCGCTTNGFGDYLEHCGGLIWAVVEGPFGLDFDSGSDFSATMEPRFPAAWPSASMRTRLRGQELALSWTRSPTGGSLSLLAKGAESLRIRVVGCPSTTVLELQPGEEQQVDCPAAVLV